MRVRFILTGYALESGKVIAAAREVFGKRVARYANCRQPVTVECSAERFVRFLIARNEHDATNSFKDLKLEIIDPIPEPRTAYETFD
jgi:hypothetical protein